MRFWLSSLAWLLLLTPVASRQLSTIRVADGENLQAAIDAAKPGDTILLQAGARFTGNFVLRHHADSASFITIRTDGRDLPANGERTGPRYSGRLAIIQSATNEPAIHTAPRAHHWRLENLELRANKDGYGEIVALGSGKQRERDEMPHTLVLDRLYIVGDAKAGQKRGIALNSGATEIRNCYIADIKSVGIDTQAIAGWNGAGPYIIENNYLEAAGENLLFGGADPQIAGLVPEDIVIRRNFFTKPIEWRAPIVAVPEQLRGTPLAEGGTLAGSSYRYQVAAERSSGQGTTAVSAASSPVALEVPSGTTGSVTLEWNSVPEATGYRVYRLSDGDPVSWRTQETRFTDSGAPGAAGKPRERGTVWTVKNLLELKSARNVTIEGNVLEHNWVAGQPGYAILFTVVNQDGGAPWSTIEDVRFTNNIVRSVSAAINILGTDQRRGSERARRITIANNLFTGIDREEWAGTGDFMQIGGGPEALVVENNTVLQSGRVIHAYGSARGDRAIEKFVFRRNLVRHNKYGVRGAGTGSGEATLRAFFPGAVFEGNILAGGPKKQYPDGNRFPSIEEFEREFVNARAGNYRLKPGSAYQGAGADLDRIEAATGESAIAPARRGETKD